MTGSVAFWYEPINSSAKRAPKAEIHFNLWRDLVVRGSNYLDVGVLFKSTTVDADRDDISRSVDSFFLFFPADLRLEQVSDLSPLMEHGGTLNAVFNDVVSITERHQHYFRTSINGTPHLTFYKLDVADDIQLQTIETEHDQLGTIFIFKRSLCERISGNGDHYFRLRFVLNGRSRDLFTSDSQPSDWFVLSSFVRTELTEFRLNERRSFPGAVNDRARHFFDIVTVHYFLMRNLRFELSDAHTNFHKMRRLEPNLWKHYLEGNATRPRTKLARAPNTGARNGKRHTDLPLESDQGVCPRLHCAGAV
jgi:hypothetical protein